MGNGEQHATVVTPERMRALPRAPLGNIDGVTNTVLWSDGTSMTGLLHVEGGHRLGSHSHGTHLHHMWVVGGDAVIAGEHVSEGAFVHVPPGIDHDIDATGTGGVTVYYSYVRLQPA